MKARACGIQVGFGILEDTILKRLLSQWKEDFCNKTLELNF